MRALESRVIQKESQRIEKMEATGVEEDLDDPMDATSQELLNIIPEERETQHLDKIVELLAKNAKDFVAHLSDEQQSDVARCCLYHYFSDGELVCGADEDTSFFFVLLHGSIHIEETRVSHQEGSRSDGDANSMRTTMLQAGKGFHHYPLVMQSRFYGYTATVDDPRGASVLLISKADYVHILRRTVEKEMTDTVSMLKNTPFFSSWSDTSMARLYFWFERRKLAPEEDVVKQGSDADFCFIIRSGRCDVLVEVADGEGEGAPSESGGSSIEASPAFMRGGGGGAASPGKLEAVGEEGGGSPSPTKSPMSKLASKRKNMLKMAAAAAFRGDAPDAPPLRANMRHIVTLRPGAIVGEIALFKDGVKRMATVRTSDNVEILILDKKSFLDLDKATLNIISENARYNAACTKEPSQRTRDDLQILQQRTAHLSHLSSLSTDVHLELCRVMRYRKVNENAILVRKGMPAQCLYVLISGAASTYITEPRQNRRWSQMATAGKAPTLRRRNVSVEAFIGMKATDVLRAGEAIGEDELLQENPVFNITAVTTEPVELMEIERHDFDRILKADRTSERGRLIEFLNELPMLDGTAVAAIHTLSNNVTRKSFMRDQLCLAHPPDQSLGSASYCGDFIYLIFSGEARLMCGAEPLGTRAVPVIDSSGPAYGPAIDEPPPHNSRVERHLGSTIAPVATLGPGECISESMLPGPGSRWCLRPITQMEILIIPRKDLSDTLRMTSIQELKGIAGDKAAFFHLHLQHILAQTAAMHQMRKANSKASMLNQTPRTSKRMNMVSERATPRNAYEPIVSPRESGSPRLPAIEQPPSPMGSPTRNSSPRRQGMGSELPPMGNDPAGKPKGMDYAPAIKLGKSSAIGMRPLHAGL